MKKDLASFVLLICLIIPLISYAIDKTKIPASVGVQSATPNQVGQGKGVIKDFKRLQLKLKSNVQKIDTEDLAASWKKWKEKQELCLNQEKNCVLALFTDNCPEGTSLAFGKTDFSSITGCSTDYNSACETSSPLICKPFMDDKKVGKVKFKAGEKLPQNFEQPCLPGIKWKTKCMAGAVIAECVDSSDLELDIVKNTDIVYYCSNKNTYGLDIAEVLKQFGGLKTIKDDWSGDLTCCFGNMGGMEDVCIMPGSSIDLGCSPLDGGGEMCASLKADNGTCELILDF